MQIIRDGDCWIRRSRKIKGLFEFIQLIIGLTEWRRIDNWITFIVIATKWRSIAFIIKEGRRVARAGGNGRRVIRRELRWVRANRLEESGKNS